MKLSKTGMDGLVIIEPTLFKDERGYFFESYNQQEFFKFGITTNFIQDNQSFSVKNVLRGLHFQAPPFAQAKLVRVIKGAALDVVVDIRKSSPTYGRHFKIELTENINQMLFIPEGFAHGFVTLQNNTVFLYKCSNVYHKPSEGGIIWNDPDLNIDWGIADPIISEKDQKLQRFKNFNSPF